MKKVLIILASGILALAPAAAQLTPISPVEEVYNDPAWRASLLRSYGVKSNVEPELTEDDKKFLREAGITELLQSKETPQLRQALTQIEAYIQSNPTASALLSFLAGTLNYQFAQDAQGPTQGQFQEKALNHYRNSVSAKGFPDYLRAHKNLAQLLLQMDKESEAKKHFIRALELGDKESRTFGLLGYIYFNEGKMIAAEAALRNALMTAPDNFQFQTLLGQALLAQDRWEEANAIFSDMIIVEPNNAELWKAQVNTYLGMDNKQAAVENMETLRLMGKADPSILTLLGDVYMSDGLTDLAAEAYIAALKKDQRAEPDRYIEAAQNLINFGAYELGLDILNALDQSFQNRITEQTETQLLIIRSQANIGLGEGAQAAQNLEDVIARDALNGPALLSLADYYSGEGNDQARALFLYERAQDVQDRDIRRQAYVRAAQLSVRKEEFEKAAEYLEEAQALQFTENVQKYLDQVIQARNSKRARS